jgi:tetratricopeptide (TPR) repeat protein
MQLKKNKEALPYLKKVIELENKNANAYYSYGGCLLSIGMYEEGVEQIRIASELDDKYWSRYNNVKNAVEVIKEYNEKKK